MYKRENSLSCPDLRSVQIYKGKRAKKKKKEPEEEYNGSIDSDWDDHDAASRRHEDLEYDSDEKFNGDSNSSYESTTTSSDNSDESNDDSDSYFEESRRYYCQDDNEHDHDQQFVDHLLLQDGLKLSDRCIESFVSMNSKKDKKFLDFYEPFIVGDKLSNTLQRKGNSHRRCVLQIESSHSAKCNVVNPVDNIAVIEISGRSKCGQAYSEDEVLVEILKKEGQNEYIHRWGKRIQTEMNTYGKVIGVFERKRYYKVRHPVLVCELDRFDNDKAKPICKTVAKIQLVSSKELGIFELEVFTYNKKLKTLETNKVMKINPSLRRKYMFFVCIISWKGLYPIGAIIGVHKSSENQRSGLKILEIQHAVRKLYTLETVEAVGCLSEKIIQEKMKEDNRKDLTNLKVFTIDPPNSKDLDDALSVEKLENDQVGVGVHIADVTSLVEKEDAVDIEAQQRATTFYPGACGRPYHMLPEPLAELCSLLPNKSRLTVSLFLIFDKDFKLLPVRHFHKSIVKSCKQFTYREVQDIIDDQPGTSDSECKEEINVLFSISKQLRKQRFGFAGYACPVEIDLYDDIPSQITSFEAHCLVEEFMVLANSYVAQYLIASFPNCVPLRCQDPPSTEKVNKWIKQYPKISHLIFHLQDKQPKPDLKLAISNMEGENGCRIRYNVVTQLQKWVWDGVINGIESGNFKEVYKLFGQDGIHPFQALALDEWYSFQETAKYKCSGNVTGRERRHFSLPQMPCYVHFTSPIRRYVDMIAHRLLHAALNRKESPYTCEDVKELCKSITERGQQAKRFSKQCRALHVGNRIVRDPIMLHGFIQDVSDKDLLLIFPGLPNLPLQSRKIPFNLLDVCAIPQLIKNRDDLHSDGERDMVALKWHRRIYSRTERPPRPKSSGRGYVHTPPEHGGPYQRIDPHQKTEFQQLTKWLALIKVMCNERASSELHAILRNTSVANIHRYVPSTFYTELDINSEIKREEQNNSNDEGNTTNTIITEQFSKYSMSFCHGQVIAVQMSSDFTKGILLPKPELFDMTGNIKYCLQHTSDPVRFFERYSTDKSKQRYSSELEYMQIWLPIILMETATAAARESPIVISDLPVSFDSHGGHFTLFALFCEERNIDFSSMKVENVHPESESEDDENTTEYVSCSDYLCLRCPVSRRTNNYIEPRRNSCPYDFRYWLSHAKIDKTKRVKKNTPEERINVHFSLISSVPAIPESFVREDKKFRCSIDLIQKSEVDK